MEHEATINVRMPDALKRGGTRVLDANGISPTQLIRQLYSYMEREGGIPECLDGADSASPDIYEQRRKLARNIAGSISLPEGFDVKQERASRIEEKHGELL